MWKFLKYNNNKKSVFMHKMFHFQIWKIRYVHRQETGAIWKPTKSSFSVRPGSEPIQTVKWMKDLIVVINSNEKVKWTFPWLLQLPRVAYYFKTFAAPVWLYRKCLLLIEENKILFNKNKIPTLFIDWECRSDYGIRATNAYCVHYDIIINEFIFIL